MKAMVPVGQRQRFSTLEIIRNWLVAFTRGFADSLRGAIELFLLDYRYICIILPFFVEKDACPGVPYGLSMHSHL